MRTPTTTLCALTSAVLSCALACVLTLALLPSPALATNVAIIINGDPVDRCGTHARNVALASAALRAHGFEVIIAKNTMQLRRAVKRGQALLAAESTLLIYTTGHGTGRWMTGNGFVSLWAPHIAKMIGGLSYRRGYYIGDQCDADQWAREMSRAPRMSVVGMAGKHRCEKFARERWGAFAEDGDLGKLMRATRVPS